MIALALHLEVAEYIAQHAHLREEAGRRLVVRNGAAQLRTLIVGATPVTVRAPRVDDCRPGARFTGQVLPPYVRRSQCLEEALPIFYLRGLSTGDIAPVLAELLGEAPKGFSLTNIVRLKQVWEASSRRGGNGICRGATMSGRIGTAFRCTWSRIGPPVCS
jgi:putative transposase